MVGTGLDVSVVLPTFNESASLPVLVPRIVDALASAELKGEIIVVDDNSPDGTADVARKLAEAYPVRVCQRTNERGLATAVMEGFRLSEAEVCVVMDADGSHPVEALGTMVRLILEDKAEIVVGSRHVPGGGSKDWPLFSQLKSRFAASLAFGLTTMTDPTTGFMAVRRSRLEGLKLDPVGWKIVLETVVKAHPARIAEVPIVFTDREHGESKQSLRVLGQYLQHLYKLYEFRFPTLVELFKFCLVGFLGVFVDLSVVTALKELAGMDTRLCQVFGFAAAVTFNYAINRSYSFKRAQETPLLYSFVAYVAANMLGLTVRMVAIHMLMRLTQLDRGHGYLLLSVIGIVLATAVNFVGVKYFAFAPERLAPVDDHVDDEPDAPDTKTTRIPALMVAIASLALVLFAFVRPHELTHDERVNLTMAENIQRGLEGFIHPSVTPGLKTNWREEALPHLGNTPVYPLLLAMAGRAGSLGQSALGALAWLITLVCVGLGVRRLDGRGARAALMAWAASPALVSSFSLYEFEPLVAMLGLAGFVALTRADERKASWLAGLAGVALGLGFAVKMWLIVPSAFACFGFLLSRAYRTTGEERSAHKRTLAVFALSGLAAALSHLAFVALVAPEDLRAWIDWVYLGIFSGRGVTGPKLSGEGAVHGEPSSAFAYLWWLARDHGALAVPLVFGLPAATRRPTAERRAFFAASLGALMGLVPLSVPAVKEPLYMLPALPFFYMLAGLTLAAPERAPPRYGRVNVAAARTSLFVAGTLCVTHVLAFALAYGDYTLHGTALRIAHVALWTLPSLAALRYRAPSASALYAALASLGLSAWQTLAGP